MQAVQALKRRRTALLSQPDRFRLWHFARSIYSSRSGHATRLDAFLVPMRPRLPELYFANLELRQRASCGAGPKHRMTDRAQGIQMSHGKEDIVIGFGRNVQRAANWGQGARQSLNHADAED